MAKLLSHEVHRALIKINDQWELVQVIKLSRGVIVKDPPKDPPSSLAQD